MEPKPGKARSRWREPTRAPRTTTDTKPNGVCWHWRIRFTDAPSVRWPPPVRKNTAILLHRLVPGVGFVAFNDVDDLKRQFDGSVCAICLETIQGEGGIRPLSPEFLQSARQLCDRTGALLILDEIQCGLGRTGKYFAYQHYGIKPDIVTVAKPLAAGLPLGALLTTDRVASGMHPGMHGTTFGGGPLGLRCRHRIPARAGSHVRTHSPNRRLLPRQAGRPQSQTRLRAGNSRHGIDAGHESGFAETGPRR